MLISVLKFKQTYYTHETRRRTIIPIKTASGAIIEPETLTAEVSA
jgi:hypothetical protein